MKALENYRYGCDYCCYDSAHLVGVNFAVLTQL